MEIKGIWTKYPLTYRQQEMQTLMRWIVAGQSGSVVGLPGCGRSNLLNFLCHRPDAVNKYILAASPPVALIPLNLHALPASDMTTFYRYILRAFYRMRAHFPSAVQAESTRLYRENLNQLDPFLTQGAIEELLLQFRGENIRVVWVLNYFHHLFEEAFFSKERTSKIMHTLRGLRDNFKDNLCLIVGMTQEISYFPNSELLGDMHELLDRNVCWVGAMADQDAHNLIARALAAATTPPSVDEVHIMLRLSGKFPALLKLICHWWLDMLSQLPRDQWLKFLMAQSNIRYRLRKMWDGLTPEERRVLSEIGEMHTQQQATATTPPHLLRHLAKKGICKETEAGWKIRGDVFSAYVEEMDNGPEKIWMDPMTQQIHRGRTQIEDLTPFEWRLLDYLIRNPYRPHHKHALIAYIWEDKSPNMVDNDLQQLVYRVRKKIDTDPPQYIITWKGHPGGYQFYPEGIDNAPPD